MTTYMKSGDSTITEKDDGSIILTSGDTTITKSKDGKVMQTVTKNGAICINGSISNSQINTSDNCIQTATYTTNINSNNVNSAIQVGGSNNVQVVTSTRSATK